MWNIRGTIRNPTNPCRKPMSSDSNGERLVRPNLDPLPMDAVSQSRFQAHLDENHQPESRWPKLASPSKLSTTKQSWILFQEQSFLHRFGEKQVRFHWKQSQPQMSMFCFSYKLVSLFLSLTATLNSFGLELPCSPSFHLRPPLRSYPCS